MAAAAAAGLECPVCYEVPAAHVHQCAEGHCFCAECDSKIENRLCPICREPLPAQRIRNIIMEQQIAALPETCSYCSTVMTRGVMAAHQLACAQRPRACVASGAGCKWTGLVAVQPAHEETCPFAVCQRMMAPLQAQNEQLKTQSEQLKTQVEELQPLRAENQRLRARVAALEEAGEEGGRRQRQRVGPAPHDPAPTDEAIVAMTLETAVAALQAHLIDQRVVQNVCLRLEALAGIVGEERKVAEAGALEAIVEAMSLWADKTDVARAGSRALWSICYPSGSSATRRAILERAVAAGAKTVLECASGDNIRHANNVLTWMRRAGL